MPARCSGAGRMIWPEISKHNPTKRNEQERENSFDDKTLQPQREKVGAAPT
jgi:hypothetical protein